MIVRHRRRGLVITTLLAGASLAYVFFVFLPGQLVVADLRKQFREQQMFIVQSERLKSVIRETRERVERAEVYCNDWSEQIGSAREIPEVLGRITTAALENDVEVVRLTPQPSVEMAVFRRVPVTLDTRAEFSQVFAFLQQLESMGELVWVEDVHIQADRNDPTVVSCQLNLVVFADNHDFSKRNGQASLR